MPAPRPGHRRLITVALAAAALAFPLGAVASHQFTDVPTSSPYHADIDAIRDAGITTGCAPGLYCPKDFVTREQMAVFLNRLGALQAGKTPVVNATKVDGFDASSINRFAYADISTTETLTWPTRLIYGTVTITAPTSGYVLVNTSVTIFSNTCGMDCLVYAYVKHVEGNVLSAPSLAEIGSRFVPMSTTAVFAVAPGTNTFRIELSREELAEDLYGYFAQISAQFSPFSQGSVPPPPILD
jgi:hypothetical protein